LSKNNTEAPKAPDYAAANREGVLADAEMLPLRNAINAATTLGTSYTDPNTGKVYDFTGLGSQDIASAQLMQQLRDAPQAAEALLKIQQEYGPQYAEAARQSLQATDPTGFALREQFGRNLSSGNGLESLLNGFNAPTFEQYQGMGPEMRMLADSDNPTFDRLSSINLADTGAAKDGRSVLEAQIFDELSRAGQGDPYLERAAQQAARARGAATGNTFGDGAALNESLKVQQALRGLDTQRRNDALALLQSGQTTSDKGNALTQQNFQNEGATKQFNNAASQQNFQNKGAIVEQNNSAANAAFQNAMAAIQQRNQALQNTFAGQQSVVQQRMGAKQQDTANVQSYLGLTPIVSQGAQLSGLQQGAAPVTTGTGYQAVGTAQNAGQLGSAFAGNVFGTQADIYKTTAQNSGSPLGAIASAAAGTFGGPLGAAAAGGLMKQFSCHVARLVYGEDNPRWIVFYHWKEKLAPKWFRAIYNRYSEPVAGFLAHFPESHGAIRRWMDSKFQIA